MDGLGIKKAHVVGHSMGAYTALHVGIRHPERCISVTAAGCGWGSVADPAVREAMRKLAVETAAMFAAKGMAEAAVIYADTPTRHAQKYKDPRGFAEFARMLGEHSAQGHALTMSMLQGKRPTLWDMEADLKRFSVPLLVIVGDEDETSSMAVSFSSARRQLPRSPSFRARGTTSTARSRQPSMLRSPICSQPRKADAGSRIGHRPEPCPRVVHSRCGSAYAATSAISRRKHASATAARSAP